MSRDLLATMITTTTYGAWLPGDMRGYVENSSVLPANTELLDHAKGLMEDDPVYLTADEQARAFEALQHGAAEFEYILHAASIESWHAHFLVSHGAYAAWAVAGRLKTRMRQEVARGRIWTAGYDKRY